MGKRKRSRIEDNDLVESLLRKVKKLVKKRRRIESSSSEDECLIPTHSSPLLEEHQSELVSDLENTNEIPIDQTHGVAEETYDDSNSQDLEPEVLELLGTDPTQNRCFGENLQKDLATRWQHILINGLPRDEKSDLMKQYLPAENCAYMKAPKLNLEIKSALTEPNFKKDSYSEQKQNQMASCLAAIGKGLNIALSRTSHVPQEIIKTLSDAGRLLCDTHYRESVSRRYSIVNSLSRQKREVIKNTKIDEYLFGSDLNEHLKCSKAISKSASELKPNTGRARYQQSLAQPSTSGMRRADTLNARGAPRVPAAERRVNPPYPRRQAPLRPPAPPPPPPPPPPPLPPPPPAPPRDRYRGTNRTKANYNHQNWRR